MDLRIPTPRWGLPFLEPCRYKGLKGGRGSGKSHFLAEMVVEAQLMDPYLDVVCLREIQRSTRLSSKKLIESKIRDFGLQDSFTVLEHEIRRRGSFGPTGIMVFQGMQDHTAETIKSLDGFGLAWFEEASRASKRSLELLRPTIREEGSEVWFSWNPDQETDPIEKFLVADTPENAIVTHVNYTENPFLPDVMKEEARIWQKDDPDTFGHVWLGEYNTKADDQVLHGKWEIDEFEVQPHWDGPYYGNDWGFSSDPNAIVEVYVDTKANRLYIRREACKVGVEVEDTPGFFAQMPGMEKYVMRADSARPEMISYMKRHGYPKIQAAEKWPGSVEDGISKLRSFDKIVLHPDCPKTAEECRLYKYKRDRLTGDILPIVIDKHNHLLDGLRYSIEPLTKPGRRSFLDF